MVREAAGKNSSNIKIWSEMSKAAQRKEKQHWAIEKPQLDNARKLRGICSI